MNRTRTLSVLAAVLGAASVGAHAPTPIPTPAVALLVLNKEDASLAIVDPSRRQVVGRVPTGEGPHEVGPCRATARWRSWPTTARGRQAARFSVIDLVAQKELRRVDVKPLVRPHGLAVADGNVFTSETEKMIGQYDPVTGAIAPVFRTGQEGTHIPPRSTSSRR